MYMADKNGAIEIEIGPPAALTAQERAAIEPCLRRRGLTTGLLDIMTNIPHRTCLVKARSETGQLLGLTSILSTPFIYMKHCFGEGNHIGTNNTFFFADRDRQAEVLSAIFKKLTSYRRFGYYVGMIDDDFQEDFRRALKKVPHVVARKVMESGHIRADRDAERLLREHGRLSRQVNRFANRGGSVHIHEGPVSGELNEAFIRCCMQSYDRHEHPVKRIDVQGYAEHVRTFLMKFPGMVHMYARLEGRVVGVQSFVRHERHLELSEGGFLSSVPTYHAYENIIVASARYAADHGLERVSYGLITNRAKDRLMDGQGRTPVFFIMFFRSHLVASVMRLYRYRAHKRFPMPYWHDPGRFGPLPF